MKNDVGVCFVQKIRGLLHRTRWHRSNGIIALVQFFGPLKEFGSFSRTADVYKVSGNYFLIKIYLTFSSSLTQHAHTPSTVDTNDTENRTHFESRRTNWIERFNWKLIIKLITASTTAVGTQCTDNRQWNFSFHSVSFETELFADKMNFIGSRYRLVRATIEFTEQIYFIAGFALPSPTSWTGPTDNNHNFFQSLCHKFHWHIYCLLHWLLAPCCHQTHAINN